MYRDERAIQELWVREGLSFLDAQRKLLETEPKTGTQPIASVLHHPQGVDAITQKPFLPRASTTLLQPIMNNGIMPD
jgi:hypothetical protein